MVLVRFLNVTSNNMERYLQQIEDVLPCEMSYPTRQELKKILASYAIDVCHDSKMRKEAEETLKEKNDRT